MATLLLGKNDLATSNSPGESTQVTAVKFSAVESGDLDNIQLYIHTGKDGETVKCAVYDDNGGVPINILGVSSEEATTTSETGTWVSFSIDPTIPIVKDTVYWLAWHPSHDDIAYRWQSGNTGQRAYDNAVAYPNFNDPFDVDGTLSQVWSIFGEDTSAVEGTNMQVNIGDDWKSVAAMKINIDDDWKAVAGAQINMGDAWKTIF